MASYLRIVEIGVFVEERRASQTLNIHLREGEKVATVGHVAQRSAGVRVICFEALQMRDLA